ncbi:MAG: Gfo/Idh/MocA family oxidoreductase [Planctomycetota bacterium]|nr:Gfo/Idh/MocA family oxidoreductase [Planctomycetota bacterium]MDA1213517.1 Gfo/Idh/MocA family oxidoreductase [Planctomycetota bacterium]
MAKIKIGQIGVGHAHAGKLGVYRRLTDDFEVVGIVESNDDLRKRAEGKDPYRDLTWMTQEQLLNVPDLQAVMVETEVKNLLDTAESCIAAGKHVHLDKPAGENYPQYKRILNEAASKHLMVQMGYMYRYSPAIIMLREFLNRGWLGDVFEVHTVMSKVVDAGTRKQLAEYPGGIFFELACHITDLVIGILGKPDTVHAYPRHSGNYDDMLLDNMLAVCEYPKATATIKSACIEVDGFARRHLVVCGTEGTFHIQPLDDPAVRMALSQPRGKYVKGYQDVTLPAFERYSADAIDMAKIIRGEKDSDFSYDHDLAVQETVLRACNLPLE